MLDLIARVAALCSQREADAPWIAGTTSIVLARALEIEERALVPRLDAAVAAGTLAKRAGWYASPGHVPRLSAEQRALFDELVPQRAGDLVPVAYEPVALAVRRSKVAGADAALHALLGFGRFVRVGEHLYREAQIAEIRRRLEAALAAEGPLSAARFRDLVGTSRKYAVPLLEYFDRAGVTVRDGDVRVAAQ